MTRRFSTSGLILTAAVLMSSLGTALSEIAPPPDTRIDVVVDTLHGVAIPDPYRWLEDQESAETRRWIDSQNEYTRSALEDLPVLPGIRSRLAELMRIDRMGSRPWERDGRFFLWKKRAGDDMWVFYLREGLAGQDDVLIDPHTLSEDHTIDIKPMAASRDGKLLAYGLRQGGEDELEIRILDVDSRTDLPDRLPRALYTGLGFAAHNAGIVYGVHDRQAGSRIYHHELGAGPGDDVAIFGDGYPPDNWISPGVSEDGRYLLVLVYHGWARSEVYLKDLVTDGPIVRVVNDIDAMFTPAFAGNRIVMLTDWDAPNRRILLVDPEQPDPSAWTEIVPERSDPIESFSAVGGKVFVHTLHDVTSRISVTSLTGESLGDLTLPGLGAAAVPFGTWASSNAFVSFQSFTIPRTVYHLDVRTGDLDAWGWDAIDFMSAEYDVQQIWYSSKDGTEVPMFLVHKKGLARSGDHPTWLHGYGGFNVSMTPWFSPMVAVWLEAGGVYALANIRGGGEFGEAWHRAGMLERKQNVFDDFIAAAEWLTTNGVTNPSKLAIQGGSNGGLLVGAALTQRPDLFQAVLCEYPDLDMVRYHAFRNNNPPALLEYGDASDSEQFEFLYAYSPYQRVTDGTNYPAVLLTTGDADTRVPPLQARKMTARLQAATASVRPIMLLYDTRAGHAGGKPLSKQIEDNALTLAFLFWQLGVAPT